MGALDGESDRAEGQAEAQAEAAEPMAEPVSSPSPVGDSSAIAGRRPLILMVQVLAAYGLLASPALRLRSLLRRRPGAATRPRNATSQIPILICQASNLKVSTEEWQRLHEDGGRVDLWLKEDFNAPTRLIGGKEGLSGLQLQGAENAALGKSTAPVHTVKVTNHLTGAVITVAAPEDRYILFEAEAQGHELPYACRMGCCTACAVKVTSGTLHQPQALGISRELRDRGYALLCVGLAGSDLEVVTQDEDEVYDLQFGQSFAARALDPRNEAFVERDDYALEKANMDE